MERSDVCAVPAAGVVGEAMMAIVLAEAFLEKFGGDSVDEIRRNYQGYLDYLKELVDLPRLPSAAGTSELTMTDISVNLGSRSYRILVGHRRTRARSGPSSPSFGVGRKVASCSPIPRSSRCTASPWHESLAAAGFD